MSQDKIRKLYFRLNSAGRIRQKEFELKTEPGEQEDDESQELDQEGK